ncbi:hypothetical protein BDZ89DRAFT_1043866 [Hymenopellis radicata]|nr:hypothetical protein BDZ89DRAFT_1043866 [Hymenopellis radicata]
MSFDEHDAARPHQQVGNRLSNPVRKRINAWTHQRYYHGTWVPAAGRAKFAKESGLDPSIEVVRARAAMWSLLDFFNPEARDSQVAFKPSTAVVLCSAGVHPSVAKALKRLFDKIEDVGGDIGRGKDAGQGL